MKVERAQLQRALAVVKPGLANKELLEQTTSFAFLGGKVVTYNDEISISHPVDGIDFDGAIKAEELYELLTRITNKDITITPTEGELLIQSGKMKAGLKMETEIKLPLREVKDLKKIPDPENFAKFLSMAMKTCSNDLTQPRLACVNVRRDGIICASDGYRLIHCSGVKFPVEDFLLPATSAADVLKLYPNQVGLEKGWVHFGNEDGATISCRRLDDTYIPYEKIQMVLKMSNKDTIEFPERIEERLDRVRQFAKRDFIFDELVQVRMEGGKIFLRAEAEGTKSWIEEKDTIDTQETVDFSLMPSMLSEILKLTRSFVLDKSGTKMKFQGDDWEYVIMLRGKD